jgi:metallophosphoesterase (TIGR00282 family)
MNILAVGDIIGAAGVAFLKKNLWDFRRDNKIDCVIANGENSAPGNGIDIKSANLIIESGVDMITTGNHVWHKKEIYNYMDENNYILRPANYPAACPGAGYNIINISGYKILFINLMGTVYFDLGLESPFETADKIFARERANFDFAVIDIHAEATGEKVALAKYIDGNYKAGLIFGTHTHIQTADEQILKNGAGYITDLGMTGGSDSVLGVKSELIIKKYLTRMPVKFEPCEENIELRGVIAKINEKDFKCEEIKRVKFTGI